MIRTYLNKILLNAQIKLPIIIVRLLQTSHHSPIAMTAGFTISKVEDKIEIRKYLEKYKNKSYKDTPLMDHFAEISQIVARSHDNDVFKAQLLIIYDVLLRKEFERKSPVYYNTSSHRDGLDVLNFFMDLINHIAGYTEKYYEEIKTKMDHE